MYKRNFYENYSITSEFAEDRSVMYAKYKDADKHEGIDYSHKNRFFDIYNLIDGVCKDVIHNDKIYGNSVKIAHNFIFAGGANTKNFYSQYCHLETINTYTGKGCFVEAGRFLGLMGTTGNSTGVHLHLMMYEDKIERNTITPLLNDILTILNVKLTKEIAFWQFNKLFYNPLVIQDYLKKLKEKH